MSLREVGLQEIPASFLQTYFVDLHYIPVFQQTEKNIMKAKSIIRRIALGIVSQPKANVHVTIQSVNYKGILSGKSIVVTGGSRGIGFSMAKKFVSEGARVLITGRNEENLKTAVSQLGIIRITSCLTMSGQKTFQRL